MSKRHRRTDRPLYGKAHDDKYPHIDRVRELFQEHIDRFDELLDSECESHHLRNLIVGLRNRVSDLVGEIYKVLKVELKHSTRLHLSARDRPYQSRGELLRGKLCQVCGEDRAVQVCHIIPRSEGGRDQENNFLFLCPNHHFFFDHARLTQHEFESLVLSDKASDSLTYFSLVHRRMHEMYWQYGTNKFAGCSCGARELSYHPARNGNVVQVALQCTTCNEIWLNVWTDFHPISAVRIQAYDAINDHDLEEAEKEERLCAAVRGVEKWISQNLGR